jgi:hypothetical protein
MCAQASLLLIHDSTLNWPRVSKSGDSVAGMEWGLGEVQKDKERCEGLVPKFAKCIQQIPIWKASLFDL